MAGETKWEGLNEEETFVPVFTVWEVQLQINKQTEQSEVGNLRRELIECTLECPLILSDTTINGCFLK